MKIESFIAFNEVTTAELSTFTHEQLEALHRKVTEVLKSKRTVAVKETINKLRIGDVVNLNCEHSRLQSGEDFIVVKLNIKKAKLRRAKDNRIWTVPFVYIQSKS